MTRSDAGTVVDPTDATAVRTHLERFAGADAVAEREDGAVVADFRGVTHVTVHPDGRIETGMPLHEFSGRADRLVFDHESGELHVERDERRVERDERQVEYDERHGEHDDGSESDAVYTFRRP